MMTIAESETRDASRCVNAESEQLKWLALCDNYLPVVRRDSIWRYSRPSQKGDPDQGWKLHVSATILSANRVLEKVAPYLKGKGVLFKGPGTLRELERLNSGLHYGYCQVGKFITVYPRNPTEAVYLARHLHRLTRSIPAAPAVPFDFAYRTGSCVHYRYGSFQCLEIEHEGVRTSAMRDNRGRLVPDLRYSLSPKPHWVVDPFADERSRGKDSPTESLLGTTYRAFQSLVQRGKGGVYKAFDFTVNPPRLCLLKEGRAGGEIGWDGRDGGWLVRREKEALTALQKAGVQVPDIYSSFKANGNDYLVTEFIEGQSLQEFLLRRQSRLSLSSVLHYGIDLAALISRIHAVGWLWRDCKPANIIIGKDRRLRPVDFEGACPANQPDPMWWGTPAFTPWQSRRSDAVLSGKGVDLYALGVVLYYLVTGRLPDTKSPIRLEKLRKKIPRDVSSLLWELLDPNPNLRPEAQVVLYRLRTASS